MGVLGTLVLCMLNQRGGGGRFRKKSVGLFRHMRKYWNIPEKTSCQACLIHAKNTQKNAFVRPLKVIYANFVISDSLGIVTVQNCSKITSKSIILHFSSAHQSCPVSMQPSSAQGKS